MLRYGSTLQYNIAAELTERAGAGKREPWIDDHENYFLNYNGQHGLVILKSHKLTHEIHNLIRYGSGLILSSYRDIRDTVASWQIKTGKTMSFNEAMDFAAGAISQFSEWEEAECANKLISKYEDFVQDIGNEIRRIALLLGLDTDPAEIEELSSALSASSLQRRISRLEEKELTRRAGFTWDSRTLIHLDHLNGGIIGRTKTELTHDLYMALTNTYSDWLAGHGYSL